MLEPHRKKNAFTAALAILALIYHNTVRNIRKSHRNAMMGLVSAMSQNVIMVVIFYIMFSILGLKSNSIRGDFLLFLMSGVFLFLTHTKTMGAVSGAEGSTSTMMKHAPMNTIISISSAALGALYTQLLSVFVILFIYHVAFTPITILDPVGAFGALMLAWFSGVGVGLIFFSIRPWLPGVSSVGTLIYARANMIASGKMFVANTLPGTLLAFFTWNPLFHTIDQARGYAFVNYDPRYSSITYPLYVALTLIMIGLIGEFYTRKHASLSWGAGR